MPILSRQPVGISDVVAVARAADKVSFAAVTERDLRLSRAIVEAALAADAPVYGLNRELGAGRDVAVSTDELEEFQRRTIRNSSGGIGEPLPVEQARAVIYTRLVGFSRGGAGVTLELARQYAELLNRSVDVVIPRTGSVGAADLTQLAAVAAVASGGGRVLVDGVIVPGADALAAAGLDAVTLAPHEALASLSGNSYSVGVGALVLHDLARIVNASDLVVALSVSATGGNPSPFSPPVQSAHRSVGQAASAARVRALLLPGAEAPSVQDPVSFRAAPQVHGAFAEAVTSAAASVTLELNSSTENPLVDLESGQLVSGGNFQVVGLSLAFEQLRLALGHVAATSERRTARISGLAAGARRAGETRVPGLLWYSAAAALAEVKALANPVSLSVTPLSEGVEDHSSNAALALQLLERSAALTRTVLAIEAVSAAEYVLLHPGIALSQPLQQVVSLVSSSLDLHADGLVAAVEAHLFA